MRWPKSAKAVPNRPVTDAGSPLSSPITSCRGVAALASVEAQVCDAGDDGHVVAVLVHPSVDLDDEGAGVEAGVRAGNHALALVLRCARPKGVEHGVREQFADAKRRGESEGNRIGAQDGVDIDWDADPNHGWRIRSRRQGLLPNARKARCDVRSASAPPPAVVATTTVARRRKRRWTLADGGADHRGHRRRPRDRSPGLGLSEPRHRSGTRCDVGSSRDAGAATAGAKPAPDLAADAFTLAGTLARARSFTVALTLGRTVARAQSL